jgi:hypothetical protein
LRYQVSIYQEDVVPIHVVAGESTVIVSLAAAVLAVLYAVRPTARRALRWPLVAAAVVATTLYVWAALAGDELRDRLAAAGPLPDEVEAHAKGSDNLGLALFLLTVAVLVLVWWLARPGRTGIGAAVAAAVLVVCAVAVAVTCATTLAEAAQAVWSQQPGWHA